MALGGKSPKAMNGGPKRPIDAKKIRSSTWFVQPTMGNAGGPSTPPTLAWKNTKGTRTP